MPRLPRSRKPRNALDSSRSEGRARSEAAARRAQRGAAPPGGARRQHAPLVAHVAGTTPPPGCRNRAFLSSRGEQPPCFATPARGPLGAGRAKQRRSSNQERRPAKAGSALLVQVNRDVRGCAFLL